MKKLENKETCFSKRRESCYFPSRKTRAVHGLEVRFPAKKERYPPPSRAVFQLPPRSHRVGTFGWGVAMGLGEVRAWSSATNDWY